MGKIFHTIVDVGYQYHAFTFYFTGLALVIGLHDRFGYAYFTKAKHEQLPFSNLK